MERSRTSPGLPPSGWPPASSCRCITNREVAALPAVRCSWSMRRGPSGWCTSSNGEAWLLDVDLPDGAESFRCERVRSSRCLREHAPHPRRPLAEGGASLVRTRSRRSACPLLADGVRQVKLHRTGPGREARRVWPFGNPILPKGASLATGSARCAACELSRPTVAADPECRPSGRTRSP